MRQVLAVDGGQSAIRVRHSGAEVTVEVEGVSWLEGDIERAITGELPAAAVRAADGSPLDGAMLLGQADDPRRYQDLVYVWETAT